MTSGFETTVQDVRYAGRLLYKRPGFTFFAVLTIALGLGANAAISSLVNGVLLKATGYHGPERIVQLWEKQLDGGRNPISGANYLDWAKQSHSFEAMAAWTRASMSYIQVFHPSHRPWKSLRDSHIPTASTTASYI